MKHRSPTFEHLSPEARALLGDDGPPLERRNAVPAGNRDGAYEEYAKGEKIYSGKRKEIQAIIAELVGFPALDAAIPMTLFPDQRARSKTEKRWNLRRLKREIESASAEDKAHLPWVKLATFGNTKSERGCLRNNDNVLSITGVEIDYDGGSIAVVEAVHRLKTAGTAALVYSTPTSTPEHPKWRVLAPLSKEHAPEERTRFVEMLNAVFDGEIDQQASFTLSQSFLYGSVEGQPPVEVHLVDGEPIDLVKGLPRLAKGKRKSEDGEAVKAHDDSGSAALFRLAVTMKTEGGDLDGFRDRIDETPAARRHVERVEKEQRGHGERAILRAWEKAEPHEWDSTDEFDDEAISTGGGSAVPYSEDAIALAFARKFAGKLLFDVTSGTWNRFDEEAGLWRPERGGLAHHWARLTCRRIAACDPRKTALGSAKTAEAVERLARRDPVFAVDGDVWNRDPMLIGTPMGVVDLRTGELRPGRPEDRINRSTAVAPIPLDEFDAAEHCPTWMRYLRDATGGDCDLMDFLRRFAGYCLTGSVREHALLFLHGPGGSGKSKFVETVQGFMGEWAETMSIATLSATKYDRHPEEIARLRGVRMAWSSETERGSGWAESKLKLLTGGDRLVARFMRQDSFEFDPTHKLIVIGNHAPSLESIGSDMRRRFAIVSFDHVPAKPDVHLPEKLQREWAGILSWGIRGCLDWQRRGLERPEAVTKATEDYFRSQDHFARWIEQDADLDRTAKEKTADLWESWNRFCRANSIEPGTRDRSFIDDLKRPEFNLKRADIGRNKDRGWAGIRLKDPYEF